MRQTGTLARGRAHGGGGLPAAARSEAAIDAAATLSMA